MLSHFDHVTVAVTDLTAAIRFFGLLGFEKDKDVVISGPVMERYMGIDGLEAQHVTLVLKGASPRCEVQLLHFRRPTVTHIHGLIARLTAAGVPLRNEPMVFHDRKLVFLEGPEGVTVELAQWNYA